MLDSDRLAFVSPVIDRVLSSVMESGKGLNSRSRRSHSRSHGNNSHSHTTSSHRRSAWLLTFSLLVQLGASFTLQDSSQLTSNSVYQQPALSPLTSRLHSHKKSGLKKPDIFYPNGSSEDSLPVCSPNSVCNKIDTYGSPWVERQCRCPSENYQCSSSLHSRDGHTIVDRNRQYKMCEPVKKLKRCKYFRDITWTLVTYPGDNSTQQLVHCRCPKNSEAYLIKRHEFQTSGGTGYQYSFACSPQTKLRCQRKEPCRLFSVRKNADHPVKKELVNTSSLCQCPHRKKCPRHHLDVGVIPGKVYSEDSLRTYSAYCM